MYSTCNNTYAIFSGRNLSVCVFCRFVLKTGCRENNTGFDVSIRGVTEFSPDRDVKAVSFIA